MRARIAATTYIVLSTVVIGVQLALAAGAPWGDLTMGGAFPGRLPRAMRAVALGSAALLMAFCVVVAARAELISPRWGAGWGRLICAVVAYALIAVALNAVTPSARERMVWLPVAVVLAVCAVSVARTSRAAERPVRGEAGGGTANVASLLRIGARQQGFQYAPSRAVALTR